MKNFIKINPIFLFALLLIVLSILGVYYSTFAYLIGQLQSDNNNYGLLIPVIVMYLIWEKRNQLYSRLSEPTWWGFPIILGGLSFYWLGELGGEYYIQYLSFWLVLVGICWTLMGFNKLKVLLFPLFFILTMFPFPSFVNNRITLYLKLISTEIGVKIMRLWGMSAFQDGNIIDLGFTQLQVVDACSGLRYLFPLIVLGILMAYFFRSRWWKKVFIIISTIPITIFTNSLRIALTGILSERFGTKAVEGFFHDFEGWLIFMVAFSIIAIEMVVLTKLFPETGSAPTKPDKSSIPEPPGSYTRKVQPSLIKQPQFIVSIVLLSLTFVLTQGVEFREAIPMNKSFQEFPMQVGPWTGTRHLMEFQIIEALDLTDYIMADFKDETGKAVNFYVAYYERQRKGESIHSPESCLMGGGWQFRQAGRSFITLSSGKVIPMNRAIIEKEPIRQVSYFWFPSRDRILTNAFELKWYNFWDALTRQRTDGALVRVITLIYPEETPGQAEERLKGFIQDMYPVLLEYLPKG